VLHRQKEQILKNQ